jgi:predicted alpha-1,2-mannosidase
MHEVKESSTGSSRRSFLKMAGGAAALVSTLDSVGAVAETVPPQPESAENSGRAALVEWANPLQGTDSTSLFSRGNTLPIVAVPFAMAHWALQSSNKSSWFFQPHDERLQGVRCTHQLSPWLDDYGYATFLPFKAGPSGDPSPEASARASSYRPAELEIAPHALKVHLLRYRCALELAPTERGAAMRFTFEESGPAGVFIDLPGNDAEASCDTTKGIVIASTTYNHGGVPKGFATRYAVRCDAAITGFEVKSDNGRRVAVIRFMAEAGKPITLRVGTSFISADQAALNLKSEVGDKPFDQVKTEAAATWEAALGRVRIKGASETQRRVFYSCLYRALLFPRIWHERDAAGNIVHMSPYSSKVEPGFMYADHGYWDVYRAWYPMMALIYPERLTEILQAWVNAYKEGGWFPQFPCPGYRNCMTGSPTDFVFGDAVAKGITGFDVQVAFEGLKKHATHPVAPKLGYGRPAVAEFLKLGYIPMGAVAGAAAETLDSAYGDFCIAQVARAAGKPDEAAAFEQRSHNWRNIFDPATRFVRGKMADGSWQSPFDPHTWGGAYVEGGPWQYRFAVPWDPQGLMEAMGGKDAFVAALEDMITQAPVFHVGTYGAEIHEMSEMAAVDFGQYAHSNQPVHAFLYMFAMAGRRDRTQYWAHRVMNELYTPDNFPGDEDTGSMSAWYILSSLGIYSLCPGKPEWVLGAPLFEEAEIRYQDGHVIRIEAQIGAQIGAQSGAQSGKPGTFLNHVTLNGVEVREPVVPHEAFLKDAHLVFSAVS